MSAQQLYEEDEVERFLSFFSAYVSEYRLISKEDDSVADVTVTTDHTLSEYVAYNYLLPYLPPATSAKPAFTLRRLGLTTQRLYLALFPAYHTFLLDLSRLALWKDHQRSLRYCILFWFLWFHDLLLPAFIFRIVFSLLRHRLTTHPTIEELQQRRQETAQAVRFGEAVQQRLSVTTLGPIEVWRLFKLYKSGGKVEAEEEDSFKRDALHVMNELADFHERIKNIFTWRRPDVSRRYLFFFTTVGFGALLLPTRYVYKFIYWLGGMLFWHVPPVIAALPRTDRIRVSLLFTNAPTDADCAMELIAKRIAAGQEVGKVSVKNQPSHRPSASASTEDLISMPHDTPRESERSPDDGINWKKWNERVTRSKLVVEEGRRFLSSHTSRNQDTKEITTAVNCRSGTEDGHSFLAQYAYSPGLITLTRPTLFFTSLTSTHAKLVVPRNRLRGVRRSGLLKGLCITWAPNEGGEEREERFQWVGDRDELFARLVGSDGERWLRV